MQQTSTIQQVQQPQPCWWTSQATATLATGILVLCVGVATLKQNWKRLAREEREKRAKDREQALQEQYGNFAASAFEYGHLSTLLRLMGMSTGSLDKIAMENPTAFTTKQAEEHRGRITITWQRFVQCLGEMLAAQARLRLLHDATDCLDILETFYQRCENNIQWIPEERKTFEADVRQFMAQVAVRIGNEYKRNAEHGIPTPAQVVKFKSSQKIT